TPPTPAMPTPAPSFSASPRSSARARPRGCNRVCEPWTGCRFRARCLRGRRSAARSRRRNREHTPPGQQGRSNFGGAGLSSGLGELYWRGLHLRTVRWGYKNAKLPNLVGQRLSRDLERGCGLSLVAVRLRQRLFDQLAPEASDCILI